MEFLDKLFAGQSYDKKNFFLIAGPCVVESEELVMEVADKVSTICRNLGIPYVFKASYRKATVPAPAPSPASATTAASNSSKRSETPTASQLLPIFTPMTRPHLQPVM